MIKHIAISKHHSPFPPTEVGEKDPDKRPHFALKQTINLLEPAIKLNRKVKIKNYFWGKCRSSSELAMAEILDVKVPRGEEIPLRAFASSSVATRQLTAVVEGTGSTRVSTGAQGGSVTKPVRQPRGSWQINWWPRS
jgi:hypothetical protein